MMRLRERSTFLASIRLVSPSDGSCAAGSEPFGADGAAHGGDDGQPRAKRAREASACDGTGAGNLRGGCNKPECVSQVLQKHSRLDRRFSAVPSWDGG
jgi:hypothetical protein